MKNNLKKYVALFMAMVFAIASLSALSICAADAADPLDANLVLHYDFEGADILDAVKDKAPAGAVKDNIAPIAGKINFSGLTVDNVNGTVTHTSNAAGLRAEPSADTNAVGGASTWFVRTKLDRKDDKQYFFIVEMRTFGSESIRPFGLQYDATNNKICVYISEQSTPSKGQNLGFAYEYDYTAGEYLNIAVSVAQAEVEGNQVYQSTLYVSKGLPKTADEWTKLGTKDIGAGIAQPTEANKLNLLSNGSVGCALGATIDDVRLYNRALTLDEIATIVPNGSFDGQLKQKVEENTPADTDANTETTTKVPETTAPDTTETVADDVTTTSDAAEKEGGCGAMVSAGFVGLASVALAATTVVIKKKED